MGPPGRRVAVVVAGCCVGCFNPSPHPDLPCGPGDTCPAGQRCNEAGVCVTGSIDDPDAPVDASAIDARPADARIDAPPGTVTATFGTGVTRDASLLDGDVMNDGTIDHTSVERNAWAALYRFDVSALPSTATITEVRLELGTIQDANLLTVGTAQIFRLTETWDETTVTFFERMTGVPWSAVGADPPSRDPTLLAEFAPSTDGRYEVTLPASMVQGWRADATTNAGIIIDTSSDGVGHLHLGAKEGIPANAAVLTVSYLP